jgi:hypothetical protein
MGFVIAVLYYISVLLSELLISEVLSQLRASKVFNLRDSTD